MILQDVRTPLFGTESTTTYLYGLDLISETNSGTSVTSYPLTDGLGSTTGLANSAGAVTDSYTYDVFGALPSNSGTTANAMRSPASRRTPTSTADCSTCERARTIRHSGGPCRAGQYSTCAPARWFDSVRAVSIQTRRYGSRS